MRGIGDDRPLRDCWLNGPDRWKLLSPKWATVARAAQLQPAYHARGGYASAFVLQRAAVFGRAAAFLGRRLVIACKPRAARIGQMAHFGHGRRRETVTSPADLYIAEN